MTSYVFKVVVEPDKHEDGHEAYQAHCPDIEEAVTWGDTREEAFERINQLLQALVQMRIEKGLPVPAIHEIDASAVVITV